MKKILISSFLTFTCFISFGQFPKEHLDLLSKINCGLTDSWTPDISQTVSFSDELDIPYLDASLFNYKTAEPYSNTAVGIFIFNKTDEAKVKSHNFDLRLENNHFEYISTSSYIIVLTHFKTAGKIYDSLVPELMKELRQYFKINKDEL